MSPKAVDVQNFITPKLIEKIRALKIGFSINKTAQHNKDLYTRDSVELKKHFEF